MLRVPNPSATEKIYLEDTEFEISVTLPISFKNEYADKMANINDNFSTNLYPIYKEIVKRGLKSTTAQDENGETLKWEGQVPDAILDKFGQIQVAGIKKSSLLGWLGQEIWQNNNKGFFREKPDKTGDSDIKA